MKLSFKVSDTIEWYSLHKRNVQTIAVIVFIIALAIFGVAIPLNHFLQKEAENQRQREEMQEMSKTLAERRETELKPILKRKMKEGFHEWWQKKKQARENR